MKRPHGDRLTKAHRMAISRASRERHAGLRLLAQHALSTAEPGTPVHDAAMRFLVRTIQPPAEERNRYRPSEEVSQ
jgi:hypothetical protein